jgi:surface antigen
MGLSKFDGKQTAISRGWTMKILLAGLSVLVISATGSQNALANTKTASRQGPGTHHFAANSHIKSSHLAATAGHRHLANVRLTADELNHGTRHHHYRLAAARYRHSWLQCVPYAREVSHIELSGNAFLWWAEAAGRYARGNTPEQGAVLNFRSVGRMPLGHVAVVTAVIDNRTILVTQANWIRGTITNDVTMQDVSPNNDWTQVEVELGDTSTWGAAYPTYGFIYNQPDTGTGTTTTIAAADSPQTNEVAEAPKPTPLAADAPNRNLQ